jgi:hypothetical protein
LGKLSEAQRIKYNANARQKWASLSEEEKQAIRIHQRPIRRKWYYSRTKEQKEEMLAKNRAYWHLHKDRKNARQREDRKQNPEKYRRYYQNQREWKKLWRAKNKDKLKSLGKMYRENIKMEALKHYSPSLQCVRCGIADIDVLCIDHINEDGAKQRFQSGRRTGFSVYYWLRDNNYPEGFQVLCMNCNWKKHLEMERANGR